VNEYSKSQVDVAVVGAGPYGLSIAAHLRNAGVQHRIFGRPMDSWLAHMPKGMHLKSDGFASNIYDPGAEFTLKRFCAEKGIEYADVGIPVSLDTFSQYGLAFRKRMVPELEERCITSLSPVQGGFLLVVDNGEALTARRVVLAVGITHFEYLPPSLAGLPPERLTHSFRHHDLDRFKGRKVIVIGAGASAIDLAGLLHENGADVELVARRKALEFHSRPLSTKRSLWQRIRHPQSGLGPGLRTRFCSDAPWAFHYLPEDLRVEIVRTTLGPSAGWFMREKVIGRVRTLLGQTVVGAQTQGNTVNLRLRTEDGTERQLTADYVIAATGYKVDMARLGFLSDPLRARIKCAYGAPVLSSSFESSVPGLYFAGLAAANSFGPLMRFAYGAGFAARTLVHTLVKARSRERLSAPVPSVVTITK
jgi:thioredoxin reductase